MKKAITICSLMVFGGILYHWAFAEDKNFQYVAEQAYWTIFVLIGLWGFGCIKPDA